MQRYLIKQLIRNKKKAALIILVSVGLFYFLCEFQLMMYREQQKIDALYETIPVTAYIETKAPSNTLFTLSYDKVDVLLKSGYVKDYDLEMQYLAYPYVPQIPWKSTSVQEGERTVFFYETALQSNAYGITTLNNSRLIPNEVQITFAADYSEENLRQENPVCIISHRYIIEHGLEYGDMIYLLGEAVTPNESEDKELIGVPFKIIGSYVYQEESKFQYPKKGFQNGDYIVGAIGFLSVLDEYFISEFPDLSLYGSYQAIFNEKLVTSARFTLKNTKELDAFSELVNAQNLTSYLTVNGNEDKTPLKLTIRNKDLLKAVTPLEEGLSLKVHIFPLIFITMGVIVFFLSYFCIQAKIKEIVLMHLLGHKKESLFFILMEEQILLFTIGFIVAIVIALLRTFDSTYFPWGTVVGFWIINISSCILTILAVLKRSLKENPMVAMNIK